MARRGRSTLQDPERRPSAAEEPTCTHEPETIDAAEEGRRVLEALAEYFALLRQWELNSRSDNGLAPDSTTE